MRVCQPCRPLPFPPTQRGHLDLPEVHSLEGEYISACVKSVKCLSDGGKKTENKPASRLILLSKQSKGTELYAIKPYLIGNFPHLGVTSDPTSDLNQSGVHETENNQASGLSFLNKQSKCKTI